MTNEELQEIIEAAFREGYSAGYRNGESDQCSFENGLMTKGDKALHGDQDDAWWYSNAFKKHLPMIPPKRVSRKRAKLLFAKMKAAVEAVKG